MLEQQPGVISIEAGLDAALVDLVFRVRKSRTAQLATGSGTTHPRRFYDLVEDPAPISLGAFAVRVAQLVRHLTPSSHVDLAFHGQARKSSPGLEIMRSKCVRHVASLTLLLLVSILSRTGDNKGMRRVERWVREARVPHRARDRAGVYTFSSIVIVQSDHRLVIGSNARCCHRNWRGARWHEHL